MLIREIDTCDEFKAVLALLEEMGDGAPYDEAEMKENWRKMRQYPYYKVYIAEKDGRLVGTFCLLICHNIGHNGKKFAILENVVVKPGFRGQGIGKQMMTWAMEQAQKENCYKLMLSSNLIRTGAHAFYENAGFRQHGLSFVVEGMDD